MRVAGGVALFWLLYGWFAFLAFAIFDRASNSYVVFGTWIASAAMALWWMRQRHWIGWPGGGREALNSRLSAEHADRNACAKALFAAMEQKWSSPGRQYLLEPHKVFFIKDFAYFWKLDQEYVDSNTQAQMYQRLLQRSGRFQEDEVFLQRKGCINSPHTVVVIRGERGNIHADFWAVDHFAEYRFGQFTTVPCVELQGEPP